MAEDRSLKRLRKKARKGMRGWPVATVAFYGPDLSRIVFAAAEGLFARSTADFPLPVRERASSTKRRHAR